MNIFICVSATPHSGKTPVKETHSPPNPTTAIPRGPAEWNIEQVIQYITLQDPALGIHASLFRKHVSDCQNNEYHDERRETLLLYYLFNNF